MGWGDDVNCGAVILDTIKLYANHQHKKAVHQANNLCWRNNYQQFKIAYHHILLGLIWVQTVCKKVTIEDMRHRLAGNELI